MKTKALCASIILSVILGGCAVGGVAESHTEYTTTPTTTFFSDDKAYNQSGKDTENEFVSTFNELTDVYANLISVKERVYEHEKITEKNAEEILDRISEFEIKTEEMQECVDSFIANYAENGVIYEEFMKTVASYHADFEKAERELEQMPKIDINAAQSLKEEYNKAKEEMNKLMLMFQKAQEEYLKNTSE